MSITIGDRPGRWVRGCSTDPAYDYCAVLGMGDFQTLEWLTDANNNNALDSIYVKNDLGGLIASFDTMPTGVLYDSGGSAADTVSFTTSTTNPDGSITLTYGPDAGPNYIAGTWSVAINGIGVTLFNGDTCTVNFNQTFFGTTTAYSFTTAKQSSVNVTQTGGIGWIDWDDGSGLEAFDASGGSTTTTHSYSTEALRTITVLCDPLEITAVDIATEEATYIDISRLTECVSFLIGTNANLGIVVNPGLNTNAITTYQAQLNGFTQINLQGFPSLSGSLSIKECPNLNTILHPTTSGTFSAMSLQDNDSLQTLDLRTYTGAVGTISAYGCASMSAFYAPTTSGTTSILDIYSNVLTTCDLSTHTGLTGRVWFQANPDLQTVTWPASSGTITDIRGFGCDLGYTDMTGLTLTTSSLNIDLENNGMTVTEVNHYLVDLDGMLGAGTGTIDLGSAGANPNAAPDGSSGGYDGTTAKASLQGKGYTVTTN